MRDSFQILLECRKHLGLGLDVVTGIDESIKPGLLCDVCYLKEMGQIGANVFYVWLESLGENRNDYYPLTGKKKESAK